MDFVQFYIEKRPSRVPSNNYHYYSGVGPTLLTRGITLRLLVEVMSFITEVTKS